MSAACVQPRCSMCAMRLHLQDTVCTAHVHLEAVGRAFSTKHMHRACTSEIKMNFHECSGCPALVQEMCMHPVCSAHSGKVHFMCCACAVCAGSVHPCLQHVHTVQCMGNERACSHFQHVQTSGRIRAQHSLILKCVSACPCHW